MSDISKQIATLTSQIKKIELPQDLSEKILLRLGQLSVLTSSPAILPEYDRLNRYIDWIVSLPWNKRSEDVLNLEHAKKILDDTHYGLNNIKKRVLEYISIMNLKKEKGEEGDVLRAPILCFVGLVGTGKTTIAKSIAECLGRKFARIPFGGMGSPLDLRGQSKMQLEAEPGKIIKALSTTGVKNCVILLDEIDRVTDEGRSSIMGVLVELLDPEQNSQYVDHFIDFPFDLSEVLFIATANNTNHISTAVMDRLEPINMPSYSDQEKINIGKNYMLPKILAFSGISKDNFLIDDDVWAQIVRPLGFDSGMRSLERTISGMVRKAAMMVVEKKATKFQITKDNIKEFLPKY